MICFSSSFPEWKMFSTLVLPKYFLYYFFNWPFKNFKISLHGQLVRKLPANSGDTRDTRSIPRMVERSPEVENGNLLQYSCLENSTNRGAWQAKIHRVTHTHTSQVLSYKNSCYFNTENVFQTSILLTV